MFVNDTRLDFNNCKIWGPGNNQKILTILFFKFKFCLKFDNEILIFSINAPNNRLKIKDISYS